MADDAKNSESEESLSIYYERRTSSGPLPTPEAFREYETALPGAADRILAMAEFQLQHRASIQKLALWIAFVIVIGFLIGAVTLAVVATPAAAVLFPVIPALISGGAYVYGIRKRSDSKQLPPTSMSGSQQRLPDTTEDSRDSQ